jgi:hypothetical protein
VLPAKSQNVCNVPKTNKLVHPANSPWVCQAQHHVNPVLIPNAQIVLSTTLYAQFAETDTLLLTAVAFLVLTLVAQNVRVEFQFVRSVKEAIVWLIITVCNADSKSANNAIRAKKFVRFAFRTLCSKEESAIDAKMRIALTVIWESMFVFNAKKVALSV